MRKYLSEIHTKSPKHKKRFALLVSGSFTLVIFAFWSMVSFRDEPQVAKDTTGPVNLAATIEAAPLDNILDGIKDSWKSLTDLITNGQ